MDRFKILRYLWKHIDKTLQYIMLKNLKSPNLTKKRLFKVFENHFYQLLDSILHYLEAKFYHDYFINLDHFDKNEGMMVFFMISNFNKNLKYQKPLVCVGIYGYVLLYMGIFWYV